MPQGHPGGVQTHWFESGQGTRRALLAHCSLAHAGVWGGVMDRLAPALRMVAFDLPSHGRSAAWDGQQDYHALATRIAGDLAGAGPVDLIGHSLGATVLLRLALEHPERVRSLTLIEPVLFAAAPEQDSDGHYGFEAAWRAGDTEGAARAFMAVWGSGLPWEALPQAQRGYILERIHLVTVVDAVLSRDAAGLLTPGRLEALNCPVLLLQGDRSPAVTAAINRALAARLPDARIETVAGAGHMLPITHAGPVSAAIARLMGIEGVLAQAAAVQGA